MYHRLWSKIRWFAIVASSFGYFMTAANATIVQKSLVFIDGTVINPNIGADALSTDSVSDAVAGVIPRDLLTTITGDGFNVTASLGRFGNYSITGFQTTFGEAFASVSIVNDNIVNLTGVPQRLIANFIIDGGFFALEAAPDAIIEYDLSLTTDRFSNPEFESVGLLRNDGTTTTFQSFGDDIGAVLDPDTGFVNIPLSFQSLDLGILNPNETIELGYRFAVRTDVPTAPEIAVFQFEDPFSTQQVSERVNLALEFTPVAAVPLPAALPLFLGALAGLGGLGFMTRRKAA